MEIGTTVMTIGFRERRRCDALELITSPRMNHAWIHPGGVAQDLPDKAMDYVKELMVWMCGSTCRSTQPSATRTQSSRPGSPALPVSRSCWLPGPGITGPTAMSDRLRLDLRKKTALLTWLRDRFWRCRPGTPWTPTGGSGSD